MFDVLIHSSTIESTEGSDVVDTEAAIDTNSDEEIFNHLEGTEKALLREAPLEATVNVRRSAHQCHPPLGLPYEHVFTDVKDADVASLVVAIELFNYEEETEDDNSDI